MHGHSGDIAAIANALGGASRSGSGWVCRCPAHDDQHASLKLSPGDDGKLLWKCHAGCSQEAVHDALKAQGLLERANGRQRGSIVATYDYRDEAGKLIFQVVRIEPGAKGRPKDFRQRRPARGGDDPTKVKDGWCWSVQGIRPLIYRLPEVKEAIAAGRVVFVVEGEKDATWLATLKLTATCNAGGAGKWHKGHAAALKGANVAVIPDNDDAGRTHALDVARSLQDVAKSVRLVELPELPEKGDVSDWLSRGHTIAELKDLVRAAPEWAEPAEPIDGKPAWARDLIKSDRGKIMPVVGNALVAMRADPAWRSLLAFNALTQRMEFLRSPPWFANGHWQRRPWEDNDDVLAAEWLQHRGILCGHTIVGTAALTIAKERTFHPVRDYLTPLEWDGIERIQHFASDYLGAADEPFVRAASSAMLIAAVARVMQPGCKADNIPVLEGPQGALKSTAIRTLFGAEWFTDDLDELGSRNAALQIATIWCAEIAELASMTRAEIERVKAFASRQVDQFRPPYGRNLVQLPRPSVLWGTTNQDTYLKDETGGRRFWPIRCGTVDIKRIEADRDQLWAEAVHWYQGGEPWWLADRATVELAREVQESRRMPDAWDEKIADYVRDKEHVTVGEVLQQGLGIEPGKWGRSEQMRVARYLKSQGWTRKRIGPRGDQVWKYENPQKAAVDQLKMDYEGDGG